MLLGFDSAPEKRNIFGLLDKHADLARRGIRLRQFRPAHHRNRGRAQDASLVEHAGAEVLTQLTSDKRDEIARGVPEALESVKIALKPDEVDRR